MKTMFALLSSILLSSSLAFAQAAPRVVSPSASEILYSLGKESLTLRSHLRLIATNGDPTITPAALYSGSFKVKVTTDFGSILDRRIHVDVVPSSAPDGFAMDPSHNWLAQMLIGSPPGFGFNDFVYPADSTTMTNWTVDQWRQSDPATRPRGSIQAVVDHCTQVMNDKSKMFWFEVLPLHFHCRSISLPNLKTYNDLFNLSTYTDPTVQRVMSAGDYEDVKSKLAVEIALGAVLLEAERYVETNSGYSPGLASDSPAYSSASTFLKNKGHCFPVDGKPFVKSVLGSFVMPFNQTVATVGATSSTVIKVRPPLDMVHPEPSYAIGTHSRYDVNDDDHNRNMTANNFVNFDPTDDSAAVAAESTAYADVLSSYTASTTTSVSIDSLKRASITMDNKTQKSFTFNGQGIMHFKFNVRDINGPSSSPSCTSFCQNTTPTVRGPFTPAGS